tara:strand:- start:5533 stop:6312 length:780 start_codon:yes stop_codon:yes gene_type:complete
MTNKYYSTGRPDRSGAHIHDILFALSYCVKHNYDYLGPDKIKKNDVRLLIEYLGINKTFCRETEEDFTNAQILHRKTYRKHDSKLFTSDIVEIIRSHFYYKSNYKFDNVLTITLHARRGDVENKGKRKFRYTPDEYFKNIIDKILTILNKYNYNYENIVINICSDINGSESLHNFKNLYSNCSVNMFLGKSLVETWDLMIHSDIFIMSKSSFSYVPAIYNKKCVIYQPFWHDKLDNWLDSSLIDFDNELEISIKDIIKF